MLAVGADAANHPGEVDHHAGTHLLVHADHAGFAGQVELLPARHEDLLGQRAALLERRQQVPPQEACPTGNDNPFLAKI